MARCIPVDPRAVFPRTSAGSRSHAVSPEIAAGDQLPTAPRWSGTRDQPHTVLKAYRDWSGRRFAHGRAGAGTLSRGKHGAPRRNGTSHSVRRSTAGCMAEGAGLDADSVAALALASDASHERRAHMAPSWTRPRNIAMGRSGLATAMSYFRGRSRRSGEGAETKFDTLALRGSSHRGRWSFRTRFVRRA